MKLPPERLWVKNRRFGDSHRLVGGWVELGQFTHHDGSSVRAIPFPWMSSRNALRSVPFQETAHKPTAWLEIATATVSPVGMVSACPSSSIATTGRTRRYFTVMWAEVGNAIAVGGDIGSLMRWGRMMTAFSRAVRLWRCPVSRCRSLSFALSSVLLPPGCVGLFVNSFRRHIWLCPRTSNRKILSKDHIDFLSLAHYTTLIWQVGHPNTPFRR